MKLRREWQRSQGASAYIATAKASGALVRVSPQEFLRIVELNGEPLVIAAHGGLIGAKFQHLTSYRGLAFFGGL